jgi:hypothetical protein
MADPLRVHVGLAVSREFHQIDTAAGRIHLFVPEDIGWADRETETAVDALIDDFSRWRVMGVEGTGGGRNRFWIGHQMPPTKRPGFNVDLGSNCFFTARMSGNASPGSPHASSADMADGR